MHLRYLQHLLCHLHHQSRYCLNYLSSLHYQDYQLRQHFQFRLHDKAGHELMSIAKIELTRDMTFSDSLVLAKDQEETQLYQDMQADLVQQLMRRLAAVKMSSAAASSSSSASSRN